MTHNISPSDIGDKTNIIINGNAYPFDQPTIKVDDLIEIMFLEGDYTSCEFLYSKQSGEKPDEVFDSNITLNVRDGLAFSVKCKESIEIVIDGNTKVEWFYGHRMWYQDVYKLAIDKGLIDRHGKLTYKIVCNNSLNFLNPETLFYNDSIGIKDGTLFSLEVSNAS